MGAASATYESDWRMTKYQQALVRRDIKTLICMPITSESGKILGVLSMDSPDEAMLEPFGSGKADALLWRTAQTLAQVLDSGAVAETR
jgi:putative methionine-R-sulfoxide reductase with GAF domain